MSLSRSMGETIVASHAHGHFKDYNHAEDAEYERLRSLAETENNQHRRLAAESQAAYKRGEKSEAKRLSDQSKTHAARADDLNAQAAAFVFRANNADSAPDEIDLHGLFVREALSALEYRLHGAASRNEPNIKVIVGKGLHSENHIAKLKPAVLEYCQKNRLIASPMHDNAGVVVVEVPPQFQPQPGQFQPGQPQHYQPGPGQYQQGQQGQPSALSLIFSLLKRLFC